MCSAGGGLCCWRCLLYFKFFCWNPGSPLAIFTVAGSGGGTVPAPQTAHQEFLCHGFLAPAVEEIWPSGVTHPSRWHYLGRVTDVSHETRPLVQNLISWLIRGFLILCLSGCVIKETVLIVLVLRAAGNQKCSGLLFVFFRIEEINFLIRSLNLFLSG